MLIGNVGKEPDVRYYAADQCVAHLPLATTEKGYTLQNGTVVPDHTDWHQLTFSRRLAQIVERYVHKGDKLYVEGRIRYSTIDDKRGQRRMVTDILVENMEMLTPKQMSQQNAAASNGAASNGAASAQPSAMDAPKAAPQQHSTTTAQIIPTTSSTTPTNEEDPYNVVPF